MAPATSLLSKSWLQFEPISNHGLFKFIFLKKQLVCKVTCFLTAYPFSSLWLIVRSSPHLPALLPASALPSSYHGCFVTLSTPFPKASSLPLKGPLLSFLTSVPTYWHRDMYKHIKLVSSNLHVRTCSMCLSEPAPSPCWRKWHVGQRPHSTEQSPM